MPLALWTVGLAVAAGLALSCLYLLDRPPTGPARLAAYAHAASGIAGSLLTLTLVWHHPTGLGPTTAALLASAIAGGAIIALAHLRRRKAPPLAIILHATLGLAGFVLLVAYASTP